MVSDGAAPKNSPTILPISLERLQRAINDTLGTCGHIAEINCEPMAEGKGFLSYITKVALTWEEDKEYNFPQSIIVKKPTLEKVKKLPMPQDVFSDENSLTLLHNRECDAYAIFTAHKPPPFPMAPLYLAEKITDEEDSGVLVLEDLSNIGRSLHFNDDASLDQVMTIIEQIASLQAYGFNHPEYRETIGAVPVNMMQQMLKNDPLADAAILRKRYPHKFTISDEEIISLQRQVKDSMDIVVNPDLHGYTPVLCLGDVQPNNILWKMNPDGSLTNEIAAFLDFQMTNTGHCAFDIAAFITMSMSAEARVANQEKILEHYLKTLRSKCNSDPGVTKDEVEELLAIQMKFYGLTSLEMVKSITEVAPQIGLTKERQNQMVDRMLSALHAA